MTHWRSRDRMVFNRSGSWWASNLFTLAIMIVWVSVVIALAFKVAS